MTSLTYENLTGVAHTSNPMSQQFVVEENALPVLIQLLRNHPSINIRVCIKVSNVSDTLNAIYTTPLQIMCNLDYASL
jgi:hypothetical protein